MEPLTEDELNEVLIELRINSGSNDPLFTCQKEGEKDGKKISTGFYQAVHRRY
jgi:hypothetical protein